MSIRIKQLTIDDILNNLIMPSDKENFECEVTSLDDLVQIEVNMPGYDIEDIQITVNGEYIYITANTYENGNVITSENGVYVGYVDENSIEKNKDGNVLIIKAARPKLKSR